MREIMDEDIVQISSPLRSLQVKKKPTKKRVQTERRKMQNRESQRKYRENIKARLETLQREVEVSRTQEPQSLDLEVESVPLPMVQISLKEVSFPESSLDFVDPGIESIFFEQDGVAVDFPLSDFSSSFDMDFTDQDTQLDNLPVDSYVDENFDSSVHSSREFDLGFLAGNDDSFVTASAYQPSFTSISTSTSEGNSHESPMQETETDSSLQLYSPRKPAQKNQSAIFSQESAADLIRLLRLKNNNENISVLRSAIARGYNVRDVFLAGLSALDDRDIQSRIPLPDPKKNTLTLVRTSTLQAYLSVATCLRIPITELYLPSCPSPFYQPGLTTSPSQHQSITASYSTTIPHDLLPIPLQLTVPHHPWLDLIPFPIFRERVLSLMFMKPPMIDLLDLKGDIFMSDGLFCWRSGEKGGTGQPWEARNWEAEAWFLRKWWMVVGGERGDLWIQTEWWRRVRGMGKVRIGWDEE